MRSIYCPGKLAFTEDLNDLYVDKSMLIDIVNSRINGTKRYLCVTRPRRFGKTFAADMLTAYYDRSCNSESLFAPLKIGKSASFRQHLNQYHVLRLDASSYITEDTTCIVDNKNVPRVNLLQLMKTSILNELLAEYPEFSTEEPTLLDILSKIVSATGTKFVVILDEWDAFLREFPDNGELKRTFLLFLRSTFKVPLSNAVFAAVYMTGIMPIKRYDTDTALSNFIEVTMLSPTATANLFGFTEEEARQYLSGSDLSFDDIAAWYDGYLVEGLHVFNPFSIFMAKENKKIGNYWVQTSSYEALLQYICMDFDGLYGNIDSLMKWAPVDVDVETFSNDLSQIKTKEHVLTILIHLGYLTYDSSTKTVSIPNREIYWQFKNTITENKWSELYKKIERSDKLLAAILSEKADKAADLIAESHEECSALTTYNNHEALKSTIREALLTTADAYIRWEEFPSGKGIADILYLPKKHIRTPAILIELKMNRSANSAIEQIKSKNYPARLKDYGGEILLVGISYNSKKRTHKCVIERYDTNKGTLITKS